VEVVCDNALHVRLDPKKVDSAGIVIRRFDEKSGATEGWLTRSKKIRGWVPLAGGRGHAATQIQHAVHRACAPATPRIDAMLAVDEREYRSR